jgi:hypothetical protein
MFKEPKVQSLYNLLLLIGVFDCLWWIPMKQNRLYIKTLFPQTFIYLIKITSLTLLFIRILLNFILMMISTYFSNALTFALSPCCRYLTTRFLERLKYRITLISIIKQIHLFLRGILRFKRSFLYKHFTLIYQTWSSSSVRMELKRAMATSASVGVPFKLGGGFPSDLLNKLKTLEKDTYTRSRLTFKVFKVCLFTYLSLFLFIYGFHTRGMSKTKRLISYASLSCFVFICFYFILKFFDL